MNKNTLTRTITDRQAQANAYSQKTHNKTNKQTNFHTHHFMCKAFLDTARPHTTSCMKYSVNFSTCALSPFARAEVKNKM